MADETKGVVDGFAQVAQNAATMAVGNALYKIAKRATNGIVTPADLLAVAEEMLRDAMKATVAEVSRG